MPSNRSRTIRGRGHIEKWKIEFLLYGKARHPSGDPNRESILPHCGYPFDGSGGSGAFTDGCHWRPVWEAVKAEIVPGWRAEHGNVPCWAERQLAGMDDAEAPGK